MSELELDHNSDAIIDPLLADDGTHHAWHHRNPIDAIRCAIIELRLWLRGIHPLQKQ